ncbi:MAG: sugar ABC transporter substrate-binding protein [Acidobacteria bacterium]|nr:MAG: sugar ABC transporter substrate-binding protein [Acidobacteriota bacterium]
MKQTGRLAVAALAVSLACTGGSGGRGSGTSGGAGGGPASGTLSIAVIPKGTSHVFWQSIHAGAVKAAREVGAEVIWRGPLREDDRDSQVSEVEGFVSRGVSGIVLAPLDDSALVAPVTSAMRSKIPVVIIDSGLKGGEYVSFVATDNGKGLGGKGKVVLLRYAEGSASTNEREDGFLETMKASPGIQVVSSNQYGGADVESAYKKSETLLSNYKKPDGSLGIDGIFAPNESTSFAMLRVLQDNGWAGKVHFVGFDASENLVKGLASGQIDALVVQDPINMGYLGLKTLVAHIKGQPVEKRIDTGVRVATKENMDSPEMKDVLHPDLTQWLRP